MNETQALQSLIGELTEHRTEMVRHEAALADRIAAICDMHREGCAHAG